MSNIKKDHLHSHDFKDVLPNASENYGDILAHTRESFIVKAGEQGIFPVHVDLNQSKYFGEFMVINPTPIIIKDKVVQVNIFRQTVKVQSVTELLMVNLTPHDICIPKRAFIGVWQHLSGFEHKQFALSSNISDEMAKQVSKVVAEQIDKMDDEEVTLRIQDLKERFLWLTEFPLPEEITEKIELRILEMCLLNESSFVKSETEMGTFNSGTFDILLKDKDQKPINIRPYKLPVDDPNEWFQELCATL